MLLSRKHVPTSRIHPIQFRKIWKKLLTLEIGYRHGSRGMWRSVFSTLLVLCAIYALLAAAFGPQPVNYVAVLALPLSLILSFGFFITIYLWLYFWTYFYDLDEHFMRIRKGVLIRHEVNIPYNRIHDVYVEQDMLDHVFRLYNVQVASASQISHTKAYVRGLNYANANAVRDKILERVGRSHEGAPPSAPPPSQHNKGGFWRGAR